MSKYKAGDKVVVDIKDTYLSAYGIKCYGLNGVGDYSAERIDEKTEPLSTYTEPLETKISRQAAEITRLLAENKELKERVEKANRTSLSGGRLAGQNEAWELAKKCMLMTDRERETIFGSGHNALYGVLTYFDYKHAAAKVAEWERQKEEIKVGDIYKNIAGSCFVICDVNEEDNNAQVLWSSSLSSRKTLDEITRYYTKTGRHIDIDRFLNQIGGEEE